MNRDKNIPRPPREPGGYDVAGSPPMPDPGRTMGSSTGNDWGLHAIFFITALLVFAWVFLALSGAVSSAALGPDPISAIQTKIMDHEYRIIALENSPTPTRRPTRTRMPYTPTQETWATETPAEAISSDPAIFILYVRVNVRKCAKVTCRWQYTMGTGSRIRVYPHTKTRSDKDGYRWIQLVRNGYWFAISRHGQPFGYFE